MPQVKKPPHQPGQEAYHQEEILPFVSFMSLLERFKHSFASQLGKVQHDEENGNTAFLHTAQGQENDADPYCSIEINHIHATGLQVQAEKKRRHDFRDT